MSVRFGSYNLLNMYASEDSREQTARYARVATMIQALDVDVLAVQELIADGDDKVALAGRRLSQLAEATGLRCEYAPGKPAVAIGNHRFHTALLWRDGVTPTGGWGAYAGVNVWHSLALVHLDVGATRPIKFGSFHATPFGKNRRADEAERVLSPRQSGPGSAGYPRDSRCPRSGLARPVPIPLDARSVSAHSGRTPAGRRSSCRPTGHSPGHV